MDMNFEELRAFIEGLSEPTVIIIEFQAEKENGNGIQR